MANQIFKFVVRLIPFNLFKKSKYIYYHLRSSVLKYRFKSSGRKFYLEPALSIIGPSFIDIGFNFSGGMNMRLEAFSSYRGQTFIPSIRIGNNVNIGYNFHLGCINNIVIGNNVLIASNVYISDHSHGEIVSLDLIQPPIDRPLISKGPVVIGNNVWIGENVVILPNVNIGDNTIIGANAVVTKSYGDSCVIAGNPAKLIKSLS